MLHVCGVIIVCMCVCLCVCACACVCQYFGPHATSMPRLWFMPDYFYMCANIMVPTYMCQYFGPHIWQCRVCVPTLWSPLICAISLVPIYANVVCVPTLWSPRMCGKLLDPILQICHDGGSYLSVLSVGQRYGPYDHVESSHGMVLLQH